MKQPVSTQILQRIDGVAWLCGFSDVGNMPLFCPTGQTAAMTVAVLFPLAGEGRDSGRHGLTWVRGLSPRMHLSQS
ncbi:hypothetical protein JOE50_004787 [Bradyrhizobium japonicum]|nr:hypothetical protein [Bradyrhizobium japonicum]